MSYRLVIALLLSLFLYSCDNSSGGGSNNPPPPGSEDPNKNNTVDKPGTQSITKNANSLVFGEWIAPVQYQDGVKVEMTWKIDEEGLWHTQTCSIAGLKTTVKIGIGVEISSSRITFLETKRRETKVKDQNNELMCRSEFLQGKAVLYKAFPNRLEVTMRGGTENFSRRAGTDIPEERENGDRTQTNNGTDTNDSEDISNQTRTTQIKNATFRVSDGNEFVRLVNGKKAVLSNGRVYYSADSLPAGTEDFCIAQRGVTDGYLYGFEVNGKEGKVFGDVTHESTAAGRASSATFTVMFAADIYVVIGCHIGSTNGRKATVADIQKQLTGIATIY